MTRLAASTLVVAAMCAGCGLAIAAEPSAVKPQQTVANSVAQTSSIVDARMSVQSLNEAAQMWGLTVEEMARAEMLLRMGPRKAYSSPQLSPLEALGIHARNPAERRRYAEMTARAFVQDVERVLAWNREVSAMQQKLAGDKPVVSYEGLPAVVADPAAAAMLGVPREAFTPTPATVPAAVPARRK